MRGKTPQARAALVELLGRGRVSGDDGGFHAPTEDFRVNALAFRPKTRGGDVSPPTVRESDCSAEKTATARQMLIHRRFLRGGKVKG